MLPLPACAGEDDWQDIQFRVGDALFANPGVAKLYHSYELQLALQSATGQIVSSTVVPADPRDWLPGESEVSSRFSIPSNLASGGYSLAVGLFDPDHQRPPLKLAMSAPVQAGWYSVGQVFIQ
jgi:hypothetical protein